MVAEPRQLSNALRTGSLLCLASAPAESQSRSGTGRTYVWTGYRSDHQLDSSNRIAGQRPRPDRPSRRTHRSAPRAIEISLGDEQDHHDNASPTAAGIEQQSISVPWSPPAAQSRKGVIRLPAALDLDPRDRDALLTAIAKARSWMDDLIDGRVQSFEDPQSSNSAAACVEQLTGCDICVTVHTLTHDADWTRRPQPEKLRGVDTLIFEDASMVSLWEMATLLKAADEAGVARVILCGDDRQLPPIGAGAPFADIIKSGIPPIAILNTVFRSKIGSTVQNLVAAIRACEFTGTDGDFQRFADNEALSVEFVKCGDAEPDDEMSPGFADVASLKLRELISEYGGTRRR